MKEIDYDVAIDCERPGDDKELRLSRSNDSNTDDDRADISYSFSRTSTGDDGSNTNLEIFIDENNDDDEASVLYDMDLRLHPGLKQVCEIALGGDGGGDGEEIALSSKAATSDDQHDEKVTEEMSGSVEGKRSPVTSRKVLASLVAIVIVLVLVVIFLAVLVSLVRSDTRETEVNSFTTEQNAGKQESLSPVSFEPAEELNVPSPDAEGNAAASSALSPVPTSSPTASPTPSPSTNGAYSLVLDFLGPISNLETLLDTSTPQGRAFLKIIADNQHTYETLRRSDVIQTYAVLTLYLSTSPDIWESNFASIFATSDVCSWTEVIECGESTSGERDVETIKLSRMNLDGILPEEICLLDRLIRLDMRGNNLVGAIPECLSRSSSLKVLHLDDNYFDGNIPSGILLVPTLEELQLSNNYLGGNLDSLIEGTFPDDPSRYGESWRLRQLNIDNNALTGTVPAYFGALGQLQSLMLHGNDLHGQINSMLCERATGNSDYGESLKYLTADCQEVICPCCDRCF